MLSDTNLWLLGIAAWASLAISAIFAKGSFWAKYMPRGTALLATLATGARLYAQNNDNATTITLLLSTQSLAGLAFILAAPRRQGLRDHAFIVATIQVASQIFFGSTLPWLKVGGWALAGLPLLFAVTEGGLTRRSGRLARVIKGEILGVVAIAAGLSLLRPGTSLAPSHSGWLGASLLLLAGAIRQGLPPFHVKVLSLYDEAPLSLSTSLFGSQMGVYLVALGAVPLLRETPMGVLAGAGGALLMAGVVFYAVLGFAQKDARGHLASLTLIAACVVTVCLAGTGQNQVAGAIESILTVLVISGLGIATSLLERRGLDLSFGAGQGLFGPLPALGGTYLVLGLALTGSPLTLGLIAEDLWLHTLFERSSAAGLLLIVGMALAAIAHLRAFACLFVGVTPIPTAASDLSRRERLSLGLTLLPILVLGLVPSLLSALWLKPEAASFLSAALHAQDQGPLRSCCPTLALDSEIKEIRL